MARLCHTHPLHLGGGVIGSWLLFCPEPGHLGGISHSAAHTSIHSGCASLLSPQLLTNPLLGKSTLGDWSFAWEKRRYPLKLTQCALCVTLNGGGGRGGERNRKLGDLQYLDSGPQPFLALGFNSWKTIFPWTGAGGMVSG